ncbi:MAG: response regulator transcription factor [Chloroflexi bacterium]|nr:response regulator transcription factor [Chloroflexota bacterium]
MANGDFGMKIKDIPRPEGVDLDQLRVKHRPRILVIDDEPDTVFLLKHVFQREGFDVSGAVSGKDAINKIGNVEPNLILLDLMMPEMDGWQTFEQIHKLIEVPVIIISAVKQTENIVKALQIGVDDYITKPFDHSEVLARTNSVLRRAGHQRRVNRLGFPDIELIIDLETQEIYYQGSRIQLTGKMFEVLVILARNAPRIATYEEITMKIWGENTVPVRNRLKYLVYLLRQEFERVNHTKALVKNVNRLGYKLIVEK